MAVLWEGSLFYLLYVVLSMPLTRLRGALEVLLYSLLMLTSLLFGDSFLPTGTNTGVRVLLVMVPWSVTFALFLGNKYEPLEIQEAPLTRVLFESDKDHAAAVEGKLIFDLDRYLLLFTEAKSVVAIPHEKIRSIQTPPLPIEQKPAPAVASSTPTETSPRPTATPQVLPSPIGSPTATAKP
jgi:hypothetical protein